MSYKIIQGDNRDTLKTIPDNSIDAIVTDPPYGIDFLGKSWDANTGALETYQECLRVLKPGGHILAFSAARTYHHLAITLEQAGFEIRDQIMWIYSSGFPKSQKVGKMIDSQILRGSSHTTAQRKMAMGDDYTEAGHYTVFAADKESDLARASKETKTTAQWQPQTELGEQYKGWGTALKPAHEPIALARKPLHKSNSTARNCQQWGTGAINIDACRVERTGVEDRFPSNVLGEILQADYQKYFYCPKVSRKERHIGFDDVPDPLTNYAQGDVKNHPLWDPSIGTNVQRLKHKILEHNKTLGQAHQVQGAVGNNHPTVKPIELMKYLIKLITPPGGTVLDPFNGSGSTGCAAVELGFDYIGCELDPAYVDIANKRIAAWLKKDQPEEPKISPVFEELFSAAE
jgi:site-specific DNA-methyltransferase (adenine-specific)